MKIIESFLRITLVIFMFIVWLVMVFFPTKSAFAESSWFIEGGFGRSYATQSLIDKRGDGYHYRSGFSPRAAKASD